MILELDQKLHMSWLVVEPVGHITLATLGVTTRIIYGASGKERWLLDKPVVC